MKSTRPIGDLNPLFPPSTERAQSILDQPSNLIRDNFTITTWLLMGAVLQGVVVLVFPVSYALLPSVLMLSYRFAKTIFATFGLVKNSQMDGVIAGKFSALLPDRNGAFSGKAADQDVALILLAGRSNHPMGIFGPGYKELGDYMQKMQEQLANNADKYNYLGTNYWLGLGERSTANQQMVAVYFRTLEDVHAYAHSPLHREVWEWWNKITKSHPHLSIMHEVYQAPKNHWENIYINNHLTGIAATQCTFKPETESESTEKLWIRPVFEAGKGKLRTHKGRIEKTEGDDNEKIFPGQAPPVY